MEKRGENNEDTTNFPFEIKPVNAEINAKLCQDFAGNGFVQVGPKKWLFPCGYSTEAANYYNFHVRPNDVFVATFPRSGTTWVQEMVWLLANDLNYEKAEKTIVADRVPFLEFSSILTPEVKFELLTKNSCDPTKYQMEEQKGNLDWRALERINDRRFIKTHLPFSLLPPNLLKVGCKVVYVARNPKDVAVSYYHLSRLFKILGYAGDFPKYWDYFESNLVIWAPYWEHIKEGWENRNNENVLFLFYEDINEDLKAAVAQVAAFLEKDYTNDQIGQLADHLKIENFRRNKSVNYEYRSEITNKGEENFIRKGQNGGWKDYFDEELNIRADNWIMKNLQNIPGLTFPDSAK